MAFVKIKSKGVALLQSVSASYVAMSGLTSINVTGEKSETYDSTTLDGTAYKTQDPSGYVNTATIKASGFFDPLHATYTNFATIVATPVATNFKITYTDSSPTSVVYSGAGFGIDKKVEMGKAVMADLEIVTSGAPS